MTARRSSAGIELDFPAKSITADVKDPAELSELSAALGVPIRYAGRNQFDILVELKTEELVRGLRRISAGSSGFRSAA